MDWFHTHVIVDVEMLIRLVIAALLGLLIGLEREIKRKSLGLRTILVISVASCLLTIVSIQSAYIFPETTYAEIRMDPLRLAAQIVSGVGFLGAGVILRREDDTVSGLTTAAIVWSAAGIGIATGAGFYVEATVGVGLLLVSLKLLPAVINRSEYIKLHLIEYFIKISIDERDKIEKVIKQIELHTNEIHDIKIKDLKDETHSVSLRIVVGDDTTAPEVYNSIASIDHITNIEINS